MLQFELNAENQFLIQIKDIPPGIYFLVKAEDKFRIENGKPIKLCISKK